jgi:hypothetical protein
MSVCFKCCVLSGRGLCDELITRPQDTEVLPSVVCLSVILVYKPRELGGPDPPGALAPKKNMQYNINNMSLVQFHTSH